MAFSVLGIDADILRNLQSLVSKVDREVPREDHDDQENWKKLMLMKILDMSQLKLSERPEKFYFNNEKRMKIFNFAPMKFILNTIDNKHNTEVKCERSRVCSIKSKATTLVYCSFFKAIHVCHRRLIKKSSVSFI